MTRGISILVLNERLLTTMEFNGDMYVDPFSNGEAMVKKLMEVNSATDFQQKMNEFNKGRFNYKSVSIYCSPRPDSIVFSDIDYFDKYFSDFVFFKNVNFSPMLLVDKNGHQLQLKLGDIAVYYFGIFHSFFRSEQKIPIASYV